MALKIVCSRETCTNFHKYVPRRSVLPVHRPCLLNLRQVENMSNKITCRLAFRKDQL